MERVTKTRTNSYLEQRLEHIWHEYFSDCPPRNKVIIKFGRRCPKRMGSIRRCEVKKDNFATLVLINGHFVDARIPSFVIDATITHELTHYIQGVSSPYPLLSRFPHRNGIVDKEIARRGAGLLVEQELGWLRKNWHNYLIEYQTGYVFTPYLEQITTNSTAITLNNSKLAN